MSQLLLEKTADNKITRVLNNTKTVVQKKLNTMQANGGIQRNVANAAGHIDKVMHSKGIFGAAANAVGAGADVAGGVIHGVKALNKTKLGHAALKTGAKLGGAAVVMHAANQISQNHQNQQEISSKYASLSSNLALEKIAMHRTNVDSSALKSVGYGPLRKQMEIEFLKGGVYRYRKVPESVYKDLMDTDSHGKYFYHNIRSKYDYKKYRDKKGRRVFESWQEIDK